MRFSVQIQGEALAACGRCCCICHKFCGIRIRCLPIALKEEGGEETIDNCIPVCLGCEGDLIASLDENPEGSQYLPAELRRHRDNWFSKAAAAGVSTFTQEHWQLDHALFDRILKRIPWKGAMGFIARHDFAQPFENASLDELFVFAAESENPGWEFIEPVMESMQATFVEHLVEFLELVMESTSSMDGVRSSVPPEWKKARFEKAVAGLHASARVCAEAYRTLLREARYRLMADVTIEDDPVE